MVRTRSLTGGFPITGQCSADHAPVLFGSLAYAPRSGTRGLGGQHARSQVRAGNIARGLTADKVPAATELSASSNVNRWRRRKLL